MPIFQETPQGIVLKIYVQPRSSRNKIIGLHGDSLKIAIQAPPVDDAANRMCVDFLSACLGLPRTAVEILGGRTGRTKRVLLRLSPESGFPNQVDTCKTRLLSLLNPPVSQGSVPGPKKTA